MWCEIGFFGRVQSGESQKRELGSWQAKAPGDHRGPGRGARGSPRRSRRSSRGPEFLDGNRLRARRLTSTGKLQDAERGGREMRGGAPARSSKLARKRGFFGRARSRQPRAGWATRRQPKAQERRRERQAAKNRSSRGLSAARFLGGNQLETAPKSLLSSGECIAARRREGGKGAFW